MRITIRRALCRAFLTFAALVPMVRPACAQPCLDWRLETGTRVVGPSMAYDSGRGYAVMFGGYTGTAFLDLTAEWDGSAWRLRRPPASPPARAGAMMAYDPVRKVTVLFGGDGPSGFFNDTWEYNGTTWTQRSIPAGSRPSLRTEGAMVYDAVRGVMVLFGGRTPASAPLGDTWEYNGTTWTQRPLAGPDARYLHGMAYDSANGRAVLYGGWTTYLSRETWTYDGSAWSQVTPVSVPPRRYAHALAYDPTIDAVVAHGGITESFAATDETWIFNGTTWTPSTSATRPFQRAFHAMVFDEKAGRLLMHGGAGTDTWQWTAGVWLKVGGDMPSIRTHGAMTFDTDRGVAVLFGGYQGNPIGDVWEWDGRAWSLRAMSGGPGPTFTAPMVYDEARGISVIATFGDDNTMDTWGWDGTAWTLLDADGPPSRGSHMMAYDPARERVVLFGGYDNTNNLGDTWEWDGVSWTQRASTGPIARWSAAMAHDPNLGGIVLYGGTTGPTTFADTWVWNGTTWTEVPGANQPGGRVGHAMAYHDARGSVILFGGPFVNTAWELVGTTWQPIAPASTPPSGRWLHMMAYDTVREQVLMFGGSASGSPGWQNDLWALGDPLRVVHSPGDQRADIGEPATLRVTADGRTGLTYRWTKDGSLLSNGPGVSGATTANLTITPDDLSDYGVYVCEVTGSCGTAASQPARVLPRCAADFNLDGAADILDFLDFIDAYSQCDMQPGPCAPLGLDADFNGDTSVDIIDFLDFMDAFGNGCA